jgi:class 3 adenylate cyclase
MSSKLPASQVIKILNAVFSAFDDLCVAYQVTKVKTIGDAMVVVSNLEEAQKDHAERMVDLGLAMVRITHKFNKKNDFGIQLAIRVGISTGNLYGKK